MGKYLKKFETDSVRVEYEDSERYIEPYVSYVEGDNTVHYNKPETRLIVIYNVEDASQPTQMYMYLNQQGAPFTVLGADMFSKVEIDGTEVSVQDLDTAQGQYQLSNGEHTVKYTLIDPTFIGAEFDGETHTITRLGAVFTQCSNIISVEIPSSVTSIDYGAFGDCTNLTSITIPDSVTSISSDAFRGCSSLPIVDNIRYADTYAIEAVDRTLTTYTIKGGTKWIGESAFASCSSLTSITIPNSVTNIGYGAFAGCSSLTSITIPDSVTSIGNEAFYYCSRLTSVTIGSGVTSIGGWAFAACGGLSSIVVDSNNTVYDSRGNCNAIIEKTTNTLISGCKNTIIPNNVTSIGGGAFADCGSLTSITIPNNVTSIENEAFSYCSGLTSVTIGSGVTSIGGWAFQGCSSLTSITIPDSVTSIGNSAFHGCSNLTSATIEATTPPTLGNSAFASSINYTIWVPVGTSNTYKAASGWSEYASRIHEIGEVVR